MLKIKQLSPLWMEGAFLSSFWGRDFSWEQGAYIQIRGGSGRGKTSLVKFLTGQSKDYRGEIYWGEDCARGLSQEAWSRMRSQTFSLLPQDLKLLPLLTMKENLTLRLNPQSVSPAVWESQLEALGVSNEKPLSILSQGEKQRVALVRALQGPFHWLILDEPFGHLDNHTADKAWNLILEVCKEKSAGIILTALDKGPGKPDEVLDL